MTDVWEICGGRQARSIGMHAWGTHVKEVGDVGRHG